MTSPIPQIAPGWSEGDSLRRVEDAARAQGRRVRQVGDGSLMLQCRIHGEDRNPSLHASWEPTRYGGRTLLACYGCGTTARTQEDWAVELGLEYDDLYDDRRWELHHGPRRNGARTPRERSSGARYSKLGKRPDPIADQMQQLLGGPAPEPALVDEHEHSYVDVATYTYVDDEGLPVHRVQRQVCPADGAKTFPQSWRLPSGHWSKRKPAGFREWLYRHDAVVAAVADGVPVHLVEGEKDALGLEGCGLVATTNPGGGAHFPAHLAAVFSGATVSVYLDRDDTGWARGVRVHQLLVDAGAERVQLLLPATTAVKSDVADHLAAGHDVDAFVGVSVDAVAAWAGLTAVRRHAREVEVAEAEVAAQLAVADYDRKAGRAAKAKDRARFATRWALETSRVHARLLEAAQGVVDAAGRDGGLWALEAADVAQGMGKGAVGLARSAYEKAGQAVPSDLTWVELVSVTAAAAAAAAGPATPAAAGGYDERGEGRGHLTVVRSDDPDDASPGGGAGGGGGGRRWSDERFLWPTYDIVGGTLVETIRTPAGRGEDAREKIHHKPLLNVSVRIKAKEYAEREEDVDDESTMLHQLGDREGRDVLARPKALRECTHVVLEVTDRDGHVELLRVPIEDAETGVWLRHLPVAGLRRRYSLTDKQKTWEAVEAVSGDMAIVTQYTATGWRRTEDGSHIYITADGAITADGFAPADTCLTGPLARFNLPNPTTDASRLRAAFLDHSAGLMDRFPDRVGAVLMGTAFRALHGANPWATVLSGTPGSKKSGLAGLTMHHFGVMWDRNKPMTSLSGHGATMNALRLYAHQAKDALTFLDDNPPTGPGGAEAAAKRLGDIIRLIHEGIGRARLSRTGRETLPETPPRTSGLITTELPTSPGDSGGRRGLLVPLELDDVDVEHVRALDVPESRHGRALLTSSLISWVARDRDAVTDQLHAEHQACREWLSAHPRRVPAWRNHVDAIAELYAGWQVMLAFLTDVAALTQAEAADWRERVSHALLAAIDAADDPDLIGSVGEQLVELLRHSLSNGMAYCTDIRTSGAPMGHEAALGWSQGPPGAGLDVDRLMPSWRTRTGSSIHLGWVNLDPRPGDGDGGAELVCTRSALEATLKAAAAQMTSTTTYDLGTALRALQDEGILVVDEEIHRSGKYVSRKVRKTQVRVIHCQVNPADGRSVRGRHVVLRLDGLLGERGTDTGGPAPAPGVTPSQGSAAGVGAATTPHAGDGELRLLATPTDHDAGGAQLRVDGAAEVDHRDAGVDAGVADLGDDRRVDHDGAAELEQHNHLADVDDAAEPEERAMGSYRTAGGLALPSTTVDRQGCIVCPLPCGVAFAGVPAHIFCFERLTVSTIDELRSLTHPSADAQAASLEAAGAAPVTGPSNAPSFATSPAPSIAPSIAPSVQGDVVGPAPARPSASAAARFAGAAVVVDVDAMWTGDGRRHDLPLTLLGEQVDVGHLADLAGALNLGVDAGNRPPGPGAVVVTAAMASKLGVPVDGLPEDGIDRAKAFGAVTIGHPLLERALARGWATSKPLPVEGATAPTGATAGPAGPSLRPWTRLWTQDRSSRTTFVVWLHAIGDSESAELTDPALTPAQVARRLDRFAQTTGAAWHVSASSTGFDLLQSLHWTKHRDATEPVSTRPRLTAAEKLAPHARLPIQWGEAPAFNWTRTPNDDERQRLFVHMYDRNGSWAAAAGSCDLGYGDPEHREGAAFDKRLPGLWKARLPRLEGPRGEPLNAVPDVRLPHPFGRDPGAGAQTAWLTTPTMEILAELGWDLGVDEAYVWPSHGRVFDTWQERMSAGRVELATGDPDDTAARNLVKAVYTRTLGMTGSDEYRRGRPGYAPDWLMTIQARSRANILRRCLQIGRDGEARGEFVWPVVIMADMVGWVSDDPDPVTAWPGTDRWFGPVRFGQYKHEASAILDDVVDHLSGRPWRASEIRKATMAGQLVDAGDWNPAAALTRARELRSR